MNKHYELLLREMGTQLILVLVTCITALFGWRIIKAAITRDAAFFKGPPGRGILAMFLKNLGEGIILVATWLSQWQRIWLQEPHYPHWLTVLSGYVAPALLLVGSALLLRVFLSDRVSTMGMVAIAVGALLFVGVTHLPLVM